MSVETLNQFLPTPEPRNSLYCILASACWPCECVHKGSMMPTVVCVCVCGGDVPWQNTQAMTWWTTARHYPSCQHPSRSGWWCVPADWCRRIPWGSGEPDAGCGGGVPQRHPTPQRTGRTLHPGWRRLSDTPTHTSNTLYCTQQQCTVHYNTSRTRQVYTVTTHDMTRQLLNKKPSPSQSSKSQ